MQLRGRGALIALVIVMAGYGAAVAAAPSLPPVCAEKPVVKPWPRAGASPMGDAELSMWIGESLVYTEVDRDAYAVVAHLFDPRKGRWRKARFSVGSSFSGERLVATATRMLFFPEWRAEDARHAGGVLDVRKGTWKGFSERAVPSLDKGPSRIALHQDAVVLWRRNVEVADLLADGWHQASGDRVLFDLTTLTSSLLPPPPLDLRREHFGLAINERWIVYWGGSAKNAHNNPEKLFGDGAVFDRRTRKWTVLPPGPPARSVSTFQLLGDTLLLAGGMDDLLDYAQSDRPHEERTANFQDAWTLDLTRGQWTQLELPLRATRLPVCRSCGVEAALSSAYFFGDGWLFDAATRQVHGVAPELGRDAAPQHVEALVLDSRRLLLWTEDEPNAPTGYVFDREKRRWCAVDLAPVAPVMFGARPSISAHQGRLYLWAAESSEQRETTDCPPGAPCARTFETHVTPGGAMIVSFEKVWP